MSCAVVKPEYWRYFFYGSPARKGSELSRMTSLPQKAGPCLKDREDVDRDLRLDACRGIALWFIFLGLVPDNVGSWLTLRPYGFSDTTELFMFVSGLTCACGRRVLWKKK